MTDEQTKKLYKTIGRRLKDARSKANLSQDKVASELGIARASVTNFEAGRQKLPLHTIYGFAKVVHISIDVLFPSINEIDDNDIPSGMESLTIEDQKYSVSLEQASFVRATKEVFNGIKQT